jgi:signal transduction histidine kinase
VQVDRANRLLSDLVDVALVEDDPRLAIHPAPIDYTTLLQEVVEEWKEASSGHVIDLASMEGVTVWGDRDRIAQVLGNLIGNAIKYSPAGGRIRIAVAMETSEASAESGEAAIVTTSITDQGVGIPPEDQKRIFGRYMRAKSSATAHVPGHGIGLFIVSEVVRAHGGRLWVESAPGAGSTFSFTLPTRDDASGPSPPRGARADREPRAP